HKLDGLRRGAGGEQCVDAGAEGITAIADLPFAGGDDLALLLFAHAVRTDTGAGHGELDDAAGIIDGEALCDAATERIADEIDAVEFHRGEKITECVGKALAVRIVSLKPVGKDIAGRIPGDDVIAV